MAKEIKFISNACVMVENEYNVWYEELFVDSDIENTWNSEYNHDEMLGFITEDFNNITDFHLELGDNKCVATIEYDGDLDIEAVKAWLEGQYADGFGEGLEQRYFREETETEIETEEDEETGELNEYEIENTSYYSIQLWPDDFTISVA